MSTADPVAVSRRPESYRYWAREHVRFADLDPNGHVNNSAYSVYGESARVAFFRDVGFREEAGTTRQNVVARLEIDFLHELRHPAEVQIGIQVLAIGRSSFTFGIGMFCEQRCVATMRAVQVRIDTLSRAPVALSARERAALAAYRVEADESPM